MTDLFHAALLGIIEGLTEFLPVSSTGHLLIAEHWLGARSELFNVVIQAGAILASLVVFRPRLQQLLTDIGARDSRDYLAKLAIAFLITAAGGLLAKQAGLELPETVAPVAAALIIGGAAMLLIERLVAARPVLAEVSWSVAIWVGSCQILAAVFPGTSRSTATIFAAMLAGLTSRPAATEFSFLVGIPTMLAATGYEFLKLHAAGASAAHEDWPAFIVAFVISTVVAFIAVKWLLRYVQTHRFTAFAWYRIALGLALLAIVR
ncbi:MAG: undecaprenyl-diphosphate phosphatase [Gammaproteobacteria bacterium]|nr:undecaprenyl-diphosphate phosphatase [Gammaproteobacteria bacterium]MDE2250670.1 undecaprenyl-diphosphate phosphatase [Gammaproteobacteria bacterium]